MMDGGYGIIHHSSIEACPIIFDGHTLPFPVLSLVYISSPRKYDHHGSQGSVLHFIQKIKSHGRNKTIYSFFSQKMSFYSHYSDSTSSPLFSPIKETRPRISSRSMAYWIHYITLVFPYFSSKERRRPERVP